MGVRDRLPDHVREGQEESQGLAGPQETTKHYVVEGQSLEDPLESGVCGNCETVIPLCSTMSRPRIFCFSREPGCGRCVWELGGNPQA